MEGRNLPGATSLIEDLDKKVLVILRDGRHVVGKLSSLDQFSNIVLENAHELDFIGKTRHEVFLGCMLVRSDNIVLVAQIDTEKDANLSVKLIKDRDEFYDQENVGDGPEFHDPDLWDFDS